MLLLYQYQLKLTQLQSVVVEMEEVILVVLQVVRELRLLFQRLVLLVVAEVVQEHQLVDQLVDLVDLVAEEIQVPLLDQEIHLL